MNPAQHNANDDVYTLFDHLLTEVLAALPLSLRDRLEEMPIIVEDYPSDEVLEEMEIDDRDALCGLHTGIPLTERSVEHDATPTDTIHIYREGICDLASDDEGVVDVEELKKQIRITLLHEIGHHFGLDEEDLNALGYG